MEKDLKNTAKGAEEIGPIRAARLALAYAQSQGYTGVTVQVTALQQLLAAYDRESSARHAQSGIDCSVQGRYEATFYDDSPAFRFKACSPEHAEVVASLIGLRHGGWETLSPVNE